MKKLNLNIFAKKKLITCYLELPFWLRISDNFGLIYDDGHELIIRNNFWKLWIYEIRKDLQTLLYMGSKENFYQDITINDVRNKIIQKEIPALWERCRTVIEIRWKDNNFANSLANKENLKIKRYVLQILLPHVDDFIEQYRMKTFDQMVYRISAWDISFVSFKIDNNPAYIITTYDYLSWNEIPSVIKIENGLISKPFLLIDKPSEVWSNYKNFIPRFPYEMELLEAYNYKIRGDYESAIRKAVTAFEILLDKKILDCLIQKGFSEEEAQNEIEKNYRWSDKKELYNKAADKKIEDVLSKEFLKVIEEARMLRHKIVHQGFRVSPSDRGKVRFFIDHLRFAINSLEENKSYSSERDNLLMLSNLELLDFIDQ